ncbi:MAG: hypothetical protein HRF43_19985 [Phycisphaerae bacterium]|jgi:hypothetical protein
MVAILAALAAAWMAAGSIGLVGGPLRRSLTWIALGISVIAAWPGGQRANPGTGRKENNRNAGRAGSSPVLFQSGIAGAVLSYGVLTAGAILAIALNSARSTVVNVLSVTVLLAAISVGQPAGPGRRLIRATAAAVCAFAVYGLARTSVPTLWWLSDGLGEGMGRLAGRLAGRSLWIGGTMAGMDFLVLSAMVCTAWLRLAPPPRWPRALYAASAVAVGHGAYLCLLAACQPCFGPPKPAPETSEWTWSAAAGTLIPWNLPALAGVIQLVILSAVLSWCPPPEARPGRARRRILPDAPLAGWSAALILALLVPAAGLLEARSLSLAGKKIVAYDRLFGNWEKPKHGEYGRLSVGMYGMLPTYVESLGGELVRSGELSDEDLKDAAAVLFIFPNEPWPAGALERIEKYVRGGGAILVAGEHTIFEKDVPASEGGNYFNQLLGNTSMQVRLDSAEFAVGGWLASYEALAHPATIGLDDARNQFGVVIGASVRAGWSAAPLLIGRFGFADPGDESDEAGLSNRRFDPGERLGDLVLAAEESIGRGKVVVFGDTSSFTNGITYGSYEFTSRLLAYLADAASGPRSAWRQLAVLLLAAALVGVLGWQGDSPRAGAAGAVMALGVLVCTQASWRKATLLPDGRNRTPNNLAYIDASHLEAYSRESLREDGLMGLTHALMRDGYQVLSLDRFDPAAIERAGLLVSIAPGRAFTPAERETVRKFVERGGCFISMVGYDRAGPSRALLADFGFYVGNPPGADGASPPDPVPWGHFKSPFVTVGDYRAHVRFHAGWPVGNVGFDPLRADHLRRSGQAGSDPMLREFRDIAYGPGDRTIILSRHVGRGKFILIGDTGFAMNKNLENIGGEPFEGMRENADFWRWFITYIRNETPWYPTGPGGPPEAKPELRPPTPEVIP